MILFCGRDACVNTPTNWNNNIATAIKSWPARQANPNQSLAVLMLRTSRRWRVDRTSQRRGHRPAPLQGVSVKGSECGNRISDADFLIVFHSNYGSILLSFRDMTMRWTTDGRRTDGRPSATNAYLPLKVDQQYCNLFYDTCNLCFSNFVMLFLF